MNQLLNQSIQYLKGVGPKRSKLLERLGIKTIYDLLYYFPRDYNDFSKVQKISESKIGANITIQATIDGIQNRVARRGKSILEVFVSDETGTIAATWFNQPFLVNKFHVGDRLFLHGKVNSYKYLQLLSPEYEILRDGASDVNGWGIIPVYPLTEHISQTQLRKIILTVLQQYAEFVEDVFPHTLTKKYLFSPAAIAIQHIHFPPSMEQLNRAKNRLIYEELFVLEIAMALRRLSIKGEQGISFKAGVNVDAHIRNIIPFTLTGAQERVIREIKDDMKNTKPMNRLLQGDVGSGKTVIALYAALIAVANGYQAAFMAPTELLAQQHFHTVQKFLQKSQVRLGLLTGSSDAKYKKEILAQLSNGKIDLIVGTHALIEEPIMFKNLGLVVIDEQHKFGVLQRLKLRKKGMSPDVLIMTATPIPRTLAITLFGDMDISFLDELPPGRIPAMTYWISKNKETTAYEFIRGEIKKGRQVFVIYPLVEQSEKLELKSAVTETERLRNEIFPECRVGLLHGKMKPAEKEQVMADFKEKRYDILVSTIIIEVGIDVPNATIMVIEHAERFGLAQLHQLRGRIGRGSEQSYCLLFGVPKSAVSRERLRTMVKTCDGFKIAEMDFKLRGPGEFFGTRQHGLPELKISNLFHDFPILQKARKDAFEIVNKDPYLSSEEYQKIKQRVMDVFKDRLELFTIR
ncbi:MAG: ATP-dependent DNA helicase RecG [Candidatus Kuenenia sp.]|nr:ATP-dependent DNA helicase RecG [Candidatus Kuenenia hertensis]